MPDLSTTAYKELERKTYLDETFVSAKPEEKLPVPRTDAAPITLKSINHMSYEATNLQEFTDFYVKVLGFKQLPHPNFKFNVAWLSGAGTMIHCIERDPTVPRKEESWKDRFTVEPEPWMTRRGRHTAFEVESLKLAEERLRDFGVSYDKFSIPDTDLYQIFFFDPEGNCIELGEYIRVPAELAARDKRLAEAAAKSQGP